MRRLILPLLLFFSLPVHAQLYEERAVSTVALSNTAVTVKSGFGTLLALSCYNPNSSNVYVQFYNSVSSINVGTTVADLVFTLRPGATGMRQPNNQTGTYSASTGMQVAATTTAAGSTAPTTPVNCDWVIR